MHFLSMEHELGPAGSGLRRARWLRELSTQLALVRNGLTCYHLQGKSTHGPVAMTSAYHAEGRQLDPGGVYSAVAPALAGSGVIPR